MKLAEKQTGRKIKAVQSDNGTEYCNSEMDKLFKEHGIRRRLTVPHTPEQNGVAERKNRTLVEAARCLLIQSELPRSFWAEAISTANYVQNRCVTKSLGSGTPFEKWIGHRPNVAHLRTFGCKAFILNKSPNKSKFDACGLKGIFVGYSDTSKAYRVWIPEDKKIHISGDVRLLNEFETKESFQSTTIQGNDHIAVMDNPNPVTETSDTYIESNSMDSVDSQSDSGTSCEIIDANRNFVSAEPSKRGPGRPKGAINQKYVPTKQYDLRSKDRQENFTSAVVESSPSSSDDDVEWQDAEYAFLASEISLSQAVTGPDAVEWKNAIYEEVKNLVANDTWDLVKRTDDMNVIGCRTILRNKYDEDGKLKRRKARIVARGFSQRYGIDFKDTFAPVARLSSLRTLVALSAKMGMSISQLDITSAYLHGDIDAETYMEPPGLLEEMLERILHDKPVKDLQKKAKIMLTHYRQGHNVCL